MGYHQVLSSMESLVVEWCTINVEHLQLHGSEFSLSVI